MPYLKIPLILAILLAIDQHVVQPNPPPKSHELSNFTLKDPLADGITTVTTKIMRALSWLTGLTEIGLIIASNHPSYPVSRTLLSFLPNPSNPSIFRIPNTYIFGSTCIILSSMLRRSTYKSLGSMFTYKLTIKDDHKLVTTGPYAYVRHPSYTAVLLLTVGLSLAFFSRGAIYDMSGVRETLAGRVLEIASWGAVVYECVMIWLRTDVEDEMLRKTFQGEWVQWAKKVPYKVIPWIY